MEERGAPLLRKTRGTSENLGREGKGKQERNNKREKNERKKKKKESKKERKKERKKKKKNIDLEK